MVEYTEHVHILALFKRKTQTLVCICWFNVFFIMFIGAIQHLEFAMIYFPCLKEIESFIHEKRIPLLPGWPRQVRQNVNLNPR